MTWLTKQICRWLPHKWRRLHKQEVDQHPAALVRFTCVADDLKQYRICDRCGATRLAAKRQRKPKEQTT